MQDTEQQEAVPGTDAEARPLTSPLSFRDVSSSKVRHFPGRSVDAALQRLDTEPRLQSLRKPATLKPGARYQLRLHIGHRSMDSIVSGKMPAVDPLLPDPEDARGHELEFVVQPKDFHLLSRPLQRFNLPLAGQSDPVYFTIRAPRQAVSKAELRVLLYSRNHIVQSFLLSAEITDEESTGSESRESLRVSLEFTRTERFTNLDSLEPRLLSIAINRGPGATHNISVKGTNGADGDLRLDPGTFDDQVKDLRSYLRIATEDPENPGTARFYPEITDGDPAPEPLANAIRELAKKGKKLYDALFAGAAEQQPKLRKDLVEVRKKSDERCKWCGTVLTTFFPGPFSMTTTCLRIRHWDPFAWAARGILKANHNHANAKSTAGLSACPGSGEYATKSRSFWDGAAQQTRMYRSRCRVPLELSPMLNFRKRRSWRTFLRRKSAPVP